METQGLYLFAALTLLPSLAAVSRAQETAAKPAPCLQAIEKIPASGKKTSLHGAWVGDGNFLLLRTSGTYHWSNDRQQVEGTYTVQEEKILLTEKGKTSSYPFSLWGGILQMKLPDGGDLPLTRHKTRNLEEKKNEAAYREEALQGTWTSDDSVLIFDEPRFCWRIGKETRRGTYTLQGKALGLHFRKRSEPYLLMLYQDVIELRDFQGQGRLLKRNAP